jgi:hypothetical protein
MLNLWVIQKGSLSRALAPDMLAWAAAEGAWTLLTMVFLMRASWIGFWSFVALSAAVLGANARLLFLTRNYALAFYGLFVLILAALYALHLFRSLGEAYYHSGQRWFEGRPRFIPEVEAELKTADVAVPTRLSRLGIEGCYAFPKAAVGAEPATIALKLGEFSMVTAVELVSRTRDGAGRGYRFIAASADEKKDVREFIDRVRSGGYVT